MTLRSEIEPLLAEFKKANGKGSMATANVALTKIIETLLSHIELHDHPGMSAYDPCGKPYSIPLPLPHPDVVPNTVSYETGDRYPQLDARSWISPLANMVTAPLGDVFSPPLTDVPILPPGNTAMLDALKTLHEANYVIGSDYNAIVDHLTSNPDSSPPIKIRNKPGRKPGFKKPDGVTPTPRAKAK